MNLTREQVNNVTIITVGEKTLDASNTKEFKRAVSAFVEPQAKVVLDLSQVQFIDSGGCGGMLSILRQLTAVGGDLKLCQVTRQVRMILQLIRFHQIMDILNTREEAIKAFEV